MPEFFSNESTSLENKEIARNGDLKNGALKNGDLKLQFDSVADTVEAFSMISPYTFRVSPWEDLQHCS